MANDKEVKIKLSTEADTKGAKQVQKSIADIETELKGLKEEIRNAPIGSKEFEDLSAKAGAAERSLREAGDQSRAFARKSDEAKGSARNTGGAILELSRGFEDLQYGVRGVLNNIPGLISQLGGGAGLAGVISLVAVGASIILPKLLEMGDNAGTSEKKFKSFKDTLKGLKEETEALAQFESGIDKQSIIDAYDDATRVIDLNTTAIRANFEAFKQALKLSGERGKQENQKAIEGVRQSENRGEITAAEAERKVTELKKQQAERELKDLQLLGQVDVETQKGELAALEAKRRANEATRSAAEEEIKARNTLKDELLPRLVQLAQQRDATAITVPGSVATDPNFADKFEARQKKIAEIDAEIAKILEALKAQNLPTTVAEITKDDGIFDFRSTGTRFGEAIEKFRATLEKGDTILKVAKTEDIQKNLDKAAEESKSLAEAIEAKVQEIGITQASAAQNFAGTADQRGQSTFDASVRDSETKGAEAMLKILDSIITSLGNAASSPENQKRIEQATKVLSDGLQRGEGDPLTNLFSDLVKQVQKEDGSRAQYLQKVQEVIQTGQQKYAEAIRALDEVKRSYQDISAQQGVPNH